MRCLALQKDDSITGADYLKVKKDAIHCKTIISERSQIHAVPNFLLLSSRIANYVTINCYTLLHQARRGEGKNSFQMCRNIFVADRDPSGYAIFSLRKLKFCGGRGPDMRAGGRITQRPV